MTTLNAMEHVKIGDVFVDSWGYDQTNVDFYEVTRATAAMIELTPIASKTVEDTGWASARVAPVPGAYTGAAKNLKRPKAYSSGGTVYVYVRMNSFSNASKVDDPETYSTHCSWYG